MEMQLSPTDNDNVDGIARQLRLLSPAYATTPLLDLPALAARVGVSRLLAKDEGRRMLGSFKSLGGTYAGLRALARANGTDIAGLIASRPTDQPRLICASDGNHGLAVAAAARLAGASACVFLHAGVSKSRARRIRDQGADIVWIDGTYDDAVDAAAEAACTGTGILVADTADSPDDPVVQDVMAGYGIIAAEIRQQVSDAGWPRPTHLFIQAGVGGLAAALAEGLSGWLDAPGTIVVVEPQSAPAIAAALATGKPVRVGGNLDSTAEMLACGEASAPALAILQRHAAVSVTVDEHILSEAPSVLRAGGGPCTTSSGAAGLAGVLVSARERLSPDARILIIVTEDEAGTELGLNNPGVPT